MHEKETTEKIHIQLTCWLTQRSFCLPFPFCVRFLSEFDVISAPKTISLKKVEKRKHRRLANVDFGDFVEVRLGFCVNRSCYVYMCWQICLRFTQSSVAKPAAIIGMLYCWSSELANTSTNLQKIFSHHLNQVIICCYLKMEVHDFS